MYFSVSFICLQNTIFALTVWHGRQTAVPAGVLPNFCKAVRSSHFFFRLAFPVNFSLIFHEFPAGDWKF